MDALCYKITQGHARRSCWPLCALGSHMPLEQATGEDTSCGRALPERRITAGNPFLLQCFSSALYGPSLALCRKQRKKIEGAQISFPEPTRGTTLRGHKSIMTHFSNTVGKWQMSIWGKALVYYPLAGRFQAAFTTSETGTLPHPATIQGLTL